MGKGGTKFEGAPIGCRGGGPRGLTGKEARENMRIFQETGHHPELERSVEAERGAYDDAAKLPQRNAHRPHVFMSIEIGAGEVGHIQLELFDDKTPIAARSFRTLCTGTGEDGFTKGACYRGVPFHRLQKGTGGGCAEFGPGSFLEGGHVDLGAAAGGSSQHSQTREGFNKGLTHASGGIVSMKPTGTEFTITLDTAPDLDSCRIVVGRVVTGYMTLDKAAAAYEAHLKFKESWTPPRVVDCGLLAAGGISEEAMENLYQARISSTQAEAETQVALATETPQQTSERLRREAAARKHEVRDALADGLSAASKRQKIAGGGLGGGGEGKKKATWDTLGSDVSDLSSSDEEES